MKAMEFKRPNGEHGGYMIHCLGCGNGHLFDSRWTFNGDYEKPTFSPSMLVNQHDPKSRCHSFVRDEKIKFFCDCFRKYAGQTIDLEDVD